MRTNTFTVTSTGSTNWVEQDISVEIIDGDYSKLYKPKSLIIHVSADTYVKLISSVNSTTADDTESTGLYLQSGNEYTFDPIDETVMKVKVAGVSGATTVQVSALRYISTTETQVTKRTV